MDDNITKIIKEKFDALPQSIQEIILSTNYEQTLIEIGKQYNLNVEQMGIMERETTMVMMGLTPTKNFEVELTRELTVDKIKVTQIVKDINEKIFLKIRELLKLMNTPEGEEPQLEETKKVENNETQILNSAGIEIIPDLPAVPEAQLMQAGKLEITAPIENREDILKKIEKPESVHPILAQKLSGSVQTPMAKTEHTLQNLSQNSNVANINNNVPKIDPYREIPE